MKFPWNQRTNRDDEPVLHEHVGISHPPVAGHPSIQDVEDAERKRRTDELLKAAEEAGDPEPARQRIRKH